MVPPMGEHTPHLHPHHAMGGASPGLLASSFQGLSIGDSGGRDKQHGATHGVKPPSSVYHQHQHHATGGTDRRLSGNSRSSTLDLDMDRAAPSGLGLLSNSAGSSSLSAAPIPGLNAGANSFVPAVAVRFTSPALGDPWNTDGLVGLGGGFPAQDTHGSSLLAGSHHGHHGPLITSNASTAAATKGFDMFPGGTGNDAGSDG